MKTNAHPPTDDLDEIFYILMAEAQRADRFVAQRENIIVEARRTAKARLLKLLEEYYRKGRIDEAIICEKAGRHG